jgi:hypothetical protein
MTFKSAAFDKKADIMWGSALALGAAAATIYSVVPCGSQIPCTWGRYTVRALPLRVTLPLELLPTSGAWMATSNYLRKGDKKRHIGGVKDWWLMPIVYYAGSTAIIAKTLIKFH